MQSKEEIENTMRILENLINGDKDCLKIDIENGNIEDVEHWKKEIKAIETIINSYNREKARADKLEKEYSQMLTKIDEYERRTSHK